MTKSEGNGPWPASMQRQVTWQLAKLLKYKRSKLPKNVFSVFEQPIRSEIFSVAQLEQHGESLAAAQRVSEDPHGVKKLHKRVSENGIVLLAAYHAIAETVREQRAITPAAEWLIDNFHIIEEQLRDIREHLPPEFYKELPKLRRGPSSDSAGVRHRLGLRGSH